MFTSNQKNKKWEKIICSEALKADLDSQDRSLPSTNLAEVGEIEVSCSCQGNLDFELLETVGLK